MNSLSVLQEIKRRIQEVEKVIISNQAELLNLKTAIQKDCPHPLTKVVLYVMRGKSNEVFFHCSECDLRSDKYVYP